MLEPDNPGLSDSTSQATDDAAPAAPRKRAPRKRVAPGPSEPQADPETSAGEDVATPAKKAVKKAAAKKAPAKKAPAKRPAKKAVAEKVAVEKAVAVEPPTPTEAPRSADEPKPAKKAAKRTTKKAAAKAVAGAVETAAADASVAETVDAPAVPAKKAARKRAATKTGAAEPAADDASATPEMAAPGVLFLPPAAETPRRRRARKAVAPEPEATVDEEIEPTPSPTPAEAEAETADEAEAELTDEAEAELADPEDVREAAIEQASGARRRRRRGRRGRGGGGTKADGAEDAESEETGEDAVEETEDAAGETGEDTAEGGGNRRRRRRRRSGSTDDTGSDDPPNTVTHVREAKSGKDGKDGKDGRDDDGVRGVKGSTRLEAKRQRRRDGRETTRRRAPILSEAEFLARREAVDRVMAVRQTGDRTQIAVLEDDILVEHYVTRASATSYVGNVYLGRVQNVLPSMEAAFVDIGKGRNGVLYAGEVNWDAAGLEGKARAIENALKSGDTVLVQVTKDPIGHKGARLTSQVSLPGRFLVYVPGGGMTGISRRLPDTERHRLKSILKKIVPEDAGVIVRTAAEGASEEDLTRDVERLKEQWESIEAKAKQTKSAPTLVHGEPDLATRVVRDVFNEDFKSLVVEGDEAWKTVSEYVEGVAPDLAERVTRHTTERDLFHELRVDEQLMKALDRKVWLPSGGSLVIDRTEAMTVIDVNTGKFVGSGGNLEQTVTRNNLEAAEEIVRQLRLRDVGGIVVIDFIDMVLESNRELVLRRLTECLGRDRTKHQVAEVTSLGLVQMTRKRVGEGLLEAFSETCEHCHGRGVIVHADPVEKSANGGGGGDDEERGEGRKGRRRRGRGSAGAGESAEASPAASDEQRRAANAAIAAIHRAAATELIDGELIDGELLDDDAAGGELGGVVADMVEAAVLAAEAVAAEPIQLAVTDEPAEEVEAEAEAEAEVEVEVEAEVEAEVAPRRRRRAASRPAGPPSVAS